MLLDFMLLYYMLNIHENDCVLRLAFQQEETTDLG
jgi:hypothetical protein